MSRCRNAPKDAWKHAPRISRRAQCLNRVRELAASYRMHIVFGCTLKTKTGIRNSALFVDADGKDIGVYSKTHLMTPDLVYEPGDSLPVFETALGKIGIMICADRRFPENGQDAQAAGERS